MRYHVHVVDSGAADAVVNAATLFSHLTLRCGHLGQYVVVSASTTRDTGLHEDDEATHNNGEDAIHVSEKEGIVNSDENKERRIVQAMERMMRGSEPSGDAEAAVELPYIRETNRRVVPYPYFDTSFVLAERSLCSLARTAASKSVSYFGLIIAADASAYDAIVKYYAQLPYTYAQNTLAVPLRKTVAVIHVVSVDPVRASCLVQRFIEMLLTLPQANEDNNNTVAAEINSNTINSDVEGYGEWLDRVDEVTAYFAQTLGVDVLVSIV